MLFNRTKSSMKLFQVNLESVMEYFSAPIV